MKTVVESVVFEGVCVVGGNQQTIEFIGSGIFESHDPVPTQGPDGTMTVTFTSCSEGTVTFDIPSVPISGTIPITRVANDNVPVCEALNTP